MKTLFLLLAYLSLSALADDEYREDIHEEDRIDGYNDRGYTWPIPRDSFVPNTPGWRKILNQRFAQVEELRNPNERFEGFFQMMPPAMRENFTEFGFGLARCPDELLATLQQAIREGLPDAQEEEYDAIIPGPERPLFIVRDDLLDRVVTEMLPFAEAWAGVPLVDHQAYGFRLYRNESKLHMHVDRLQTHVISFILHIDSSEDAQPWPIFIESFDGKTQEVVLTPGDILFYESSKCFHGRPRTLNGSWYTSVFAHYYPRGDWNDIDHNTENTYAVPLHWSEDPEGPRRLRRLAMVETSFLEPDCPDEWCGTYNAVNWSGPAESGFLTTHKGKMPFNPASRFSDEL